MATARCLGERGERELGAADTHDRVGVDELPVPVDLAVGTAEGLPRDERDIEQAAVVDQQVPKDLGDGIVESRHELTVAEELLATHLENGSFLVQPGCLPQALCHGGVG